MICLGSNVPSPPPPPPAVPVANNFPPPAPPIMNGSAVIVPDDGDGKERLALLNSICNFNKANLRKAKVS